MIALLTMIAALQSAPIEVVIATRNSAEAGRQTLSISGWLPPKAGVPADQQSALFAMDFDGYSAGRCLALLPTQERVELNAARARYADRASGNPAPLLDQIFQSGFTRGQIETQDELPDPDACGTMRENAPIALADLSSELADFEAALPVPLRRLD